MNKPKIADYITRVPVTADAEQTISYARGLMQQYNIRHLPVLDGDVVVGVISQRDLLMLDSLDGDSDQLPITRAIHGDAFSVEIDTDLASVAREMCARRIGSAVVTENARVVGMFTTTDALGALATALERS